MPFIDVNGVSIAYQLFGQGIPIVNTFGGWFARHPSCYAFAGSLSADHSVLIWDRRNGNGASDVVLSDAPSDWYQWTDDLHEMLNTLDLTPAYLGGISAGQVFSLLMAHRYPEDVKGLILMNIATDDVNLLHVAAEAHYFHLAEAAESQGMQQVIDSSTEAWIRSISGRSKPEDYDWLQQSVAESIHSNPDNREKILALDPTEFAAAMRRWGNWFVSDRYFTAGLSDEEIKAISVPAMIVPGWDAFHPPETARRLLDLLANAEWVDLSERSSPTQMQDIMEDKTYTYYAAALSPIIRDFVGRSEKHASV